MMQLNPLHCSLQGKCSEQANEICDLRAGDTTTDTVGVLIAKPVRQGTEDNGKLIVLEGLNVGDRIVTDGSFLLRAELLKQAP